MDTSIIVVIAIIVVFAVAVPTMIRKSATELSRVEIDTVPDEAQVVAADPQIPGHDDTERARVFHSDASVEPTVPSPDVAPLTTAPTFTLSAPSSEFALIDGQAKTRSTSDTDTTTAEAAAEHQRSVLPVAVGETHSALTDDLSRSGHQASASESAAPGMRDNVRSLHPAVRAVFNESQQNTGGGHSSGGTNPGRSAGGHLGDHSTTGPARSGSPQRETPHDRSAGPSTAGATRRGTQIPDPNFGADEDHSMSDKATRLRESKKSLGARTRGFALLFLASVLGVLVTGVLALFSVVHVAFTGVFLGLAIVSLFIVRTLNLRKRDIKARLRQLERPSTKRSGSQTKTEPRGAAAPRGTAAPNATKAPRTNAAPTSAARSAAAPRTNGAQAAAAPRSGTRSAQPRIGTQSSEASKSSEGRSAAASEPAEGRSTVAAQSSEGRSAGSTKAAQARAVMQRNVTAKHDREEANTGEIPLVRIRNEAAEGHTTRQVLLTGPIPVVEEAAPEAAETKTAGAKTAGTDTAQAAPTTESAPAAEASESSASTPETSPFGDLGQASGSAVESEPAVESESTAATADTSTVATAKTDENAKTVGAAEGVEAAGTDGAAAVRDPFMQRLQARDAWSPTPLPVPSYVDAPRVEHPVPETKAADASSYETEARSREDIAAEFAAELGYRPELSDSAREDGPLEHGRKAIRTNKAPDLGAVDDVLARRRA